MAALSSPRRAVVRHVLILTFATVSTMAGATSGCRGEKNRVVPSAVAKPCASNRDCEDGWACLATRCYDTRKGAVFTHPDQMVTPDRVRDEVEHQQNQHLRRIEKDLDGADVPGPTK
jgi:hypothetical protein